MNIYTSYFANLRNLDKNIVPISISIWPPKGYNGLEYKALAPSADILKEFKSNHDEAKYIWRYEHEILEHLDSDKVLEDLIKMGNGSDIALICYEKNGSFCHRHLAVKWLLEAIIRYNQKHNWIIKEVKEI